MTPCKKKAGNTTILMDRVKKPSVDNGSNMHVAGGAHKGIIINKSTCEGELIVHLHSKLRIRII